MKMWMAVLGAAIHVLVSVLKSHGWPAQGRPVHKINRLEAHRRRNLILTSPSVPSVAAARAR
ncbi:MAG TPA: hypothetical protein VGC82_09160, partial [Rhodopila sp.]